MTTKISAIIVILGTTLLPTPLAAQPPEFFDYLSEQHHAGFSDSLYLFHYSGIDSQQPLAPPLALLEEPIHSGLQAEVLQFLPFSDPAEIQHTDTALHQMLYNLLLQVSTMEEIQYYSASRERMRTMLHRSYFITDPERPDFVPDPYIEGTPPSHQERYLLQEDSTFGTNIYLVSHTYNGTTMRITMHNTSTVRYGFVPAMRTGDLRISLLVHPIEDGVVLYGHISADPVISLGLQSRIRNSISNRLKAVSTWFTDQTQPALHTYSELQKQR